jgi:hypothetical protein
MVRKTLLVAILFGGLSYLFSRARKEVIQDRLLDRDAKLRWEDEGGPAPVQSS